ncbi:MAG: TlpA disulfide reductase family protein [Candidatus Omnitrophota bacterium]|nr:TlpA disulfide reductase family protein [Candidatus Omnitrophota bacterium]
MKVRKSLLILSVISLFFVIAGTLSCQGRIEGSGGSIAPDFTLRDLNGNTFRFSDTKGKVVILDFWATWCPPCILELPHFQSLHEQYQDQGLLMVGISLDRGGVETVRSFVRANGITYTILIGGQKVTEAYGGIRGIPTTFVIDRRGRIVEKYVGYRSKEVFESAIKKLL